ncbi:hypothetical protein NDU88_001157 [Pleurodeles waltl]|uniref:Uncharacterized protein n=1 Tax=Pleurodeles waltl TaxID=8319 RepID=A0AAV7U7P2_PLEWA|nr:hypothetical protein NDU88_001157 [Pleurodeles waltl]
MVLSRWWGGPGPTSRPAWIVLHAIGPQTDPRRPGGQTLEACSSGEDERTQFTGPSLVGGASKQARPLSNWWSIGSDGAQSAAWEWLESTGRIKGREAERNPPASKSRRSRERHGRKGGSVTTETASHAPDLEQLIQERREALQSAVAINASPMESETEISQPPGDRPANPDRLSQLGIPACLGVTPGTADNLF